MSLREMNAFLEGLDTQEERDYYLQMFDQELNGDVHPNGKVDIYREWREKK